MNQRILIISLVQMNVIVYAVFFYAVFFIRPRQEQANALPSAVALLQTAVAISPTTMPTFTPPASATPSPTQILSTPSRTPGSPTSMPSTAAPSLMPNLSGQYALAGQRLVPTRTPKPTTSPAMRTPTSTPQKPNPVDGGSPSYPLTANGSSQTLAPGASAWYKIGSGGVHMDVFLEGNPLGGVWFEVYAPENYGRPIGRGSFENATGRLVWAGGHWNASGDWLAHVANDSANSVRYQLTSVSRVIGKCDSISYWEYIGTSLVYWTRCKE